MQNSGATVDVRSPFWRRKIPAWYIWLPLGFYIVARLFLGGTYCIVSGVAVDDVGEQVPIVRFEVAARYFSLFAKEWRYSTSDVSQLPDGRFHAVRKGCTRMSLGFYANGYEYRRIEFDCERPDAAWYTWLTGVRLIVQRDIRVTMLKLPPPIPQLSDSYVLSLYAPDPIRSMVTLQAPPYETPITRYGQPREVSRPRLRLEAATDEAGQWLQGRDDRGVVRPAKVTLVIDGDDGDGFSVVGWGDEKLYHTMTQAPEVGYSPRLEITIGDYTSRYHLDKLYVYFRAGGKFGRMVVTRPDIYAMQPYTCVDLSVVVSMRTDGDRMLAYRRD